MKHTKESKLQNKTYTVDVTVNADGSKKIEIDAIGSSIHVNDFTAKIENLTDLHEIRKAILEEFDVDLIKEGGHWRIDSLNHITFYWYK